VQVPFCANTKKLSEPFIPSLSFITPDGTWTAFQPGSSGNVFGPGSLSKDDPISKPGWRMLLQSGAKLRAGDDSSQKSVKVDDS